MEQRGSVSQIKKLAANLKRELKTTLSMDSHDEPDRRKRAAWHGDLSSSRRLYPSPPTDQVDRSAVRTAVSAINA
jgi:hypothetical protein